MGQGFEAEEKKWPWTRFFVTAALFHTRNKGKIVAKFKHSSGSVV
jgi:hypothetical protein